ncbi:MAG: DNA-directed RNA polymerase subunit omega [Pyrinomonadaceae bacterium]
MSKLIKAENQSTENSSGQEEIDSKYRLIIIAAKRSKQLLRGAKPRVDMDVHKHKPTRIAIEEVHHGKVHFDIIELEKKKEHVS